MTFTLGAGSSSFPLPLGFLTRKV